MKVVEGRKEARKQGSKEGKDGNRERWCPLPHPPFPSFLLRLRVSTHAHTHAHAHTDIQTQTHRPPLFPCSFCVVVVLVLSLFSYLPYLWSEQTKSRPSKWCVRGTLKMNDRENSQETECTWAFFILHVREHQTRFGRETPNSSNFRPV